MSPVFLDAMSVFHTSPQAATVRADAIFTPGDLQQIRQVIAGLKPPDLELHEAARFKRLLVHDHPFFTELQHRIAPLVSEAVGEPVELSYNLLSLYAAQGQCSVHLDAPYAKWSLDLCVNQSCVWPIHIGAVRPWPKPDDTLWARPDWESEIKRSAQYNFQTYSLQPGEALLFSASSQWHYRDLMPDHVGSQFSDVLFFDFMPRGTSELALPENWARLFGIPELQGI